MPNHRDTAALLDIISAAGFHAQVQDSGTHLKRQYIANAVDVITGESFSVSGPDEFTALVELAQQVGIELEDG